MHPHKSFPALIIRTKVSTHHFRLDNEKFSILKHLWFRKWVYYWPKVCFIYPNFQFKRRINLSIFADFSELLHHFVLHFLEHMKTKTGFQTWNYFLFYYFSTPFPVISLQTSLILLSFLCVKALKKTASATLLASPGWKHSHKEK